eukprot:TRINITY_DN4694_c0_g1_i1.p1 TRINITY_DN4694_c0_g1~~TRINITY_DN4694_c0_g1_i1.p1  ORF type:complete len:179 (+),score=32.92 TRINITY_DN4694_c0_g1_i1:57-593(+)
MGANTSSTLRGEEIAEIESVCNFTPREIRKLYKRFKRLDREEKGSVSTDEFYNIPELSMNPLAPRIISVFDAAKNGQVNFKQFIEVLSVFHPESSKEEKMKFAFKVYDIKEDGYIDSDELSKVLKMMVGQFLTEEQIQSSVKSVLGSNSKISYDEFRDKLQDTDVIHKMSVKFFNGDD